MESRYELKYIDGDFELKLSFDGELGIDELRNNLKWFLLGASWSSENIKRLFGEEDDN